MLLIHISFGKGCVGLLACSWLTSASRNSRQLLLQGWLHSEAGRAVPAPWGCPRMCSRAVCKAATRRLLLLLLLRVCLEW